MLESFSSDIFTPTWFYSCILSDFEAELGNARNRDDASDELAQTVVGQRVYGLRRVVRSQEIRRKIHVAKLHLQHPHRLKELFLINRFLLTKLG